MDIWNTLITAGSTILAVMLGAAVTFFFDGRRLKAEEQRSITERRRDICQNLYSDILSTVHRLVWGPKLLNYLDEQQAKIELHACDEVCQAYKLFVRAVTQLEFTYDEKDPIKQEWLDALDQEGNTHESLTSAMRKDLHPTA